MHAQPVSLRARTMLTLREAIMMRRVAVLLTSVLIPCTYAQSGPGSQDRTGSIRVRVIRGRTHLQYSSHRFAREYFGGSYRRRSNQ